MVPYKEKAVSRTFCGTCQVEVFVPPHFKRRNVSFNVVKDHIVLRAICGTCELEFFVPP